MTVHALAGLPRSGSTLLANVLAQHPDVHASGTSTLSACVEQVVGVLTNSPEVPSELAGVPGMYDRYLDALRGLTTGWYADRPEGHVIDKGRAWVMFSRLLAQLDPAAVLIVCVRDPRDVFASIDARDADTAVFWSQFGRTAWEAADVLFRPDGNVGGPMRFCEDLIRRRAPVEWVRYESFVQDPATTIERVAARMGLSPHRWDLEHVENHASDVDAVHRGKFPHDGSGPIKASGSTWRDSLHPQLAAAITQRWPLFMAHFGY